jgi:type I restriction enzyme M protein
MTPKGGVSPHTKFRVSARKSEVLFTDYIAEHLTPDGRGGVIVPNGIVATAQNAYIKLRKFLVEDSLVAVVSLPAGVFRPYSGVKTSILFLDKNLSRQTDKILFLKISADGFDLGDQRRPIPENDLPEAQRVVTAWLRQKFGEETQLAWKALSKSDLLAQRSCNLQAEAFLGGDPGGQQTIEVARLADVVEINPKKSEARGLNAKTQVSFVPMEDLNSNGPAFAPSKQRELAEVLNGYTYFKDGDVLLAKITPCFENGKAGVARRLLNGIGFGSTEFFVLRGGEKILPEFLYYLVTRDEFRTEGAARMSGTAGQQRVTREFLENYEIPVPRLEEQQQIVSEIQGYQKVIDGARQILTGYKPRVEASADWPTKELGEVCRLGRGFAFKSEDYVPRGVLNFRVTNIGKDRMPDLANAVYLPESFLNKYAEYQLRAGDFVIVMVGATTGKIGYITPDILPALLNQNMWRFFPDESVLDRRYLYYAIDQLPLLRQGGAQDYIKQSDFLRNPIALPPLDEQRRIATDLDAEAVQIASMRALISRFEGKIDRVLDRVSGNGTNL